MISEQIVFLLWIILRYGSPVIAEKSVDSCNEALCLVESEVCFTEKLTADIGFTNPIRIVDPHEKTRMAESAQGQIHAGE